MCVYVEKQLSGGQLINRHVKANQRNISFQAVLRFCVSLFGELFDKYLHISSLWSRQTWSRATHAPKNTKTIYHMDLSYEFVIWICHMDLSYGFVIWIWGGSMWDDSSCAHGRSIQSAKLKPLGPLGIWGSNFCGKGSWTHS